LDDGSDVSEGEKMTRDDIIRMAKEATNKNVLFEFPPQDIRLFERFAELVAAALAQPEREWQGLTKEELQEIAEFHFHGALSGREFYDDIEAKLKEKNSG